MKHLLLFFLLIMTINAFAQKENFGILYYTKPAGYELVENENVLTYYKEDKTTGAFCNFFVYKLMRGHGTAQQDFDFAWTNLLQTPFKVTGTASMQPAGVLKGWQLLMGTTMYADNGASAMAMLSTFSGENNMQAVCILSNADIYKKDIEDFIASVEVSKEITTDTNNNASTQSENNINSTTTNSSSIITTDNGPKPEVWMKSNFEYDMMKHMSVTKYEWIAVYPDGKFNSSMPTEGYANYYNKNKDWGKANWSGNRLNVTDAWNNVYYFDKKTSTQMQRSYDSQPHYYKSKTVEGLRIEGAYTQYASLLPSEKNEAQYLIWFYKDGTFDDRGISVVDLKNPYANPDIAPGKGKYNIENYSIFLTYDDGRIKQLGFSGFLDTDPATVTDAYFIGRNLYYRKDKNFNSNLNKIGN